MAGTAYTLSGKFDGTGKAVKTVPRPGTNAMTLEMTLDTSGGCRITGTVGDGRWSADLLANRHVFHAITNPATAYAGRYTLVIPGSSDQPAAPKGNGYGTITISASGRIVFSGSLADSTPIAQSAYVSSDGSWPLYASLYGGKGSVCSWMRFDSTQPPDDVHGTVDWIKPRQVSAKFYSSGFTNRVVAEGSRYTPPANPDSPIINLVNGTIRASREAT